jgi:hypothetical protein
MSTVSDLIESTKWVMAAIMGIATILVGLMWISSGNTLIPASTSYMVMANSDMFDAVNRCFLLSLSFMAQALFFSGLVVSETHTWLSHEEHRF